MKKKIGEELIEKMTELVQSEVQKRELEYVASLCDKEDGAETLLKILDGTAGKVGVDYFIVDLLSLLVKQQRIMVNLFDGSKANGDIPEEGEEDDPLPFACSHDPGGDGLNLVPKDAKIDRYLISIAAAK